MRLELFTVDELAKRLTDPSPVDHGLFSGVFVQVDTPHEGTLLLSDVAMLLENAGVLVFELRGQELTHPLALASLASLIDATGRRSDIQLNLLASQTLADVVTTALETRGETMALLIDGAQALLDGAGTQVLQALKAARDAANLNPGRHARLLVVATCMQPARVERFVLDHQGAFYGAAAVAVPRLPR